MKSNRMAWTLNTAAVALVGAALLLPAPDEIRKAFEYGSKAEPRIEVINTPEAAIVQFASETASHLSPVSIQSDGLEACLETRTNTDRKSIQYCVPKYISQIDQFDISAQRRIEAGLVVMPNPQIEQQRLEIAKLCRLEWAGAKTVGAMPSLEACTRIISGVAY